MSLIQTEKGDKERKKRREGERLIEIIKTVINFHTEKFTILKKNITL